MQPQHPKRRANGMARCAFALAVTLLVHGMAIGHDPRLDLPAPQSAAEAWNVLAESIANVNTLLENGQLADVVYQLANTTAPLRVLEKEATTQPDRDRKVTAIKELLTRGFTVVNKTRETSGALAQSRTAWNQYENLFKTLQSYYPPELLAAKVYICPMHPTDRHLRADDRCSICGMSLVRRHIPASTVYEKPGEPSMKIIPASSPLQAGQKNTLRFRMLKADGSPVVLSDLVEMHTQKIHLLINDATLSDYHHEHPTPTATPGEYEFSFIPRHQGPYRLWADVVPAATGIQEYVMADLPSATHSAAALDRTTTLAANVGQHHYVLNLPADGKPIREGQTVIGTVTILQADGTPFKNLEPIMGAFAHIVGFHEDLKTVIHIHPWAQEPKTSADRGGPSFTFKLFAAQRGYMKLYVQVQIDGVSQFAPFGIEVLAPESASN
jgi:hypothetical protein